MAEISKTPKKGLSLPEHYDPSVEKLRENMVLIDALLQKANPNDLSSVTDSNAESNLNTLTTTGRYLVKADATDCPVSGTIGVVDVFRIGSYVLQEWRSINTPSYEFRRVSTRSGLSWGVWRKDWNADNDGSSSGLNADLLDGCQLSSLYRKDYTASDFNSATSEGKYRINKETNAPYTGCTDWVCLVYHLSGGANELYQIAMPDYSQVSSTITGGSGLTYSNSIPMVFVRKRDTSGWYSWQSLWSSGNDGDGSGLNADKLDGKHASDFVPSIKSTATTNIDNITSEGMYEYTSITSTEDLPTFTGGSGTVFGLIVKSVKGTSSYNCCFQILLRDSCKYIYMRYYHDGSWSSWENLTPTPSQLLAKIKTVDGSGSGLNADLLDGAEGSDYLKIASLLTELKKVDGGGTGIDADLIDGLHEFQLVKYGYNSGNLVNIGNPSSTITGSSAMYLFRDTNNYIGEGSSVDYGIVQVYYTAYNYMRIAVSTSSGKVYRQTSGTTAWNEITPTDATSTTSGLMSAADKVKLDSIVEGADIYTMPTASNLVLGGVKLSDSVTSTNNTGNGIAATPAAVKSAYDKAVEVGNTRIWNSSGVTTANANSWSLSSYNLTMSGARNIALAYGFSYDTLVEMLGESNLLAACGGVLEFNGGVSAIIGGYGHKLNGGRAVILGGYNNIAHAYNVVCGKSCKEPTATDYNSNSGDLFVVGNGTTATRSNSFRVAANGNCYAGVAFNGTGADYNEVREWSDGNVDSEDRCGYMVAFDGVKIRLAQPGDNLRKVGIISGNSCITGNNFADYWHGKYKRDIYGRYETEPVHNDAEYDEDGNLIKEEYDGYSYVLSEDYDPSLEDEYIPRLDRSEYDLMATHGEVVVRDDGTCEADGYCIPGQDGIATKDNEEIGFYVMERVDENHVRVFVR